MITIEVIALTDNAFKGLKRHYRDCNKFTNRLKLKAHGVTQKLKHKTSTLTICYENLFLKISDKLKTDFKGMLKEDQKKDFVKSVDDFMNNQFVRKVEYEVKFKDDTK